MFNTDRFPFQTEIERFPETIEAYLGQVLGADPGDKSSRLLSKIRKMFKS